MLCFLATTVRFDLSAALDEWRGFDHIQRQADDTGPVRITIEGHVTRYSSTNAPDSYTLTLTRRGRSLSRTEEFTFKRRSGQGRRITVSERLDLAGQPPGHRTGREPAGRDNPGGAIRPDRLGFTPRVRWCGGGA